MERILKIIELEKLSTAFYKVFMEERNNSRRKYSKQCRTLAPLVLFFIMFWGCLFVCVEVLRSSQPNGVMSSAVSLPNHTFTGQA